MINSVLIIFKDFVIVIFILYKLKEPLEVDCYSVRGKRYSFCGYVGKLTVKRQQVKIIAIGEASFCQSVLQIVVRGEESV